MPHWIPPCSSSVDEGWGPILLVRKGAGKPRARAFALLQVGVPESEARDSCGLEERRRLLSGFRRTAAEGHVRRAVDEHFVLIAGEAEPVRLPSPIRRLTLVAEILRPGHHHH